MKPEASEWLEMAEMDLRAAQILLEDGLYPASVFHSHQAVEKILKALWVEGHLEGTPPRTHDLVELAVEVMLDLPAWEGFLGELSEQAVASRYVGPMAYTADRAVYFLGNARHVCELLRQRLS